MDKIKLAVEPRTLLGKKVRKLRFQGIVPGNIFGRDIKSQSIQTTLKEAERVYKLAGETSLVDVKFNNESLPSLIHEVQRDPISGKIIHIDFHKVNLKEKITANVPVKLVGDSPAEKGGQGLVLQTVSEIEVEALPSDLPHEIEVSIEELTEVGQSVHVKDLKLNKEKVKVVNDPQEVIAIVQTAEMKEEEVTEAPAPEDVEATAEKSSEEEDTEEKEENVEE